MEKNYEDEIEIDLKELLLVLVKKWWLITISAMLGGAAAFSICVWVLTPKYESKAMLYLLSNPTNQTSLADIQVGTELTADFEVIARSKPVLDGAIKRIEEEHGTKFTRSDIEKMLNVSNYSGTRILVITAVSEDAIHACMVANAVAEETAERMAEITKSLPPTTVEEAEVSYTPSSPNFIKNTAIGFILGLLAASAVFVLRFVMNDNIKTEEDVEKYLGLSTLVVVPYMKDRDKKVLKSKNALNNNDIRKHPKRGTRE